MATSDETTAPLASALVRAGRSGRRRRIALSDWPAPGSVISLLDRRAFLTTLGGGLLAAPLAAEALALGVVVLAGCTSVSVRALDPNKHPVKLVCIQKNPEVQIREFLGVVEDGFQRHGMETEVFDSDPPPRCEYVLTYVAVRGWDFVTYLKHVELRLKQGHKIVGTAIHKSGSATLTKFASVETKMTPLIDELLTGVSSK
jgi:hypothetical protein